MLTPEQIQNASEFHYGTCTRTIGPRGGVTEYIETWRRNGKTKLWKTRPNEFRIPVKRGLYEYGYITDAEQDLVHASEDCPLLKGGE